MEPAPAISFQAASLRAWYGSTISEFLNGSADSIVGTLARNADFAILPEQRDAWVTQIDFLRAQIKDLAGSIFLEFNIPRMGRRIDTVLLIGGIIFVIEFKVGEKSFDRAALDQVWDYALDLKNFHQASHAAPIVPILIATGATRSPAPTLHRDEDGVHRPIPAHPRAFRSVLDLAIQTIPNTAIDHIEWSRAPYHPTPTIVEAARALYAQHSVEAIARSDAGAQNLHTTSRRLEDIVDESNARRRKAICFVTGVPGAGKTLVGLNIATRRSDENQPTRAVFLSGNGPLVAVLREALTRDEVARRKATGEKMKKVRVGERVKAFIQNVHHFRDEALLDPKPPHEHVAIFDEAQRAWNMRQTASFMQRKKKRSGFSQSEPEFLISYMDRHPDWSVVVCLVGGGQEIHRGEAGIDAWLDAVNSKFPHWDMYISPRLTDTEYAAGRALDTVRHRPNTHLDDSLDLGVSMRSFRAEYVSSFIKALLDCEKEQARKAFAEFSNRYPIILTRNLDHARDWIRARARGTERYGLPPQKPNASNRMRSISASTSTRCITFSATETTPGPVITSKMPPPNSRSRGWSSTGPVLPGMPTCVSPAPAGASTISAATAGATSATPTTAPTSATPTASSSPAPARAWSSLSRRAIPLTRPDHWCFMIRLSGIWQSSEYRL
jgi:hypothetical protein